MATDPQPVTLDHVFASRWSKQAVGSCSCGWIGEDPNTHVVATVRDALAVLMHLRGVALTIRGDAGDRDPAYSGILYDEVLRLTGGPDDE